MIWQNSAISLFATTICSSSINPFRNKKPKKLYKEAKNYVGLSDLPGVLAK